MRARHVVMFALVVTGCGLDVVGMGTASGPVVDGGITSAADAQARADATDSPLADAAAGDAASSADAGECAQTCPSGTAHRLCVAGKCTEAWRVFVTQGRYPPAFADLGAADAKCEATAKSAGLGGAWRAWMSRSQQSSIDRFAKAPVPYRLLDGTIVGYTADIFPPSAAGKSTVIVHAIDRNESNAPVVAAGTELEVWTGTNRYGYGGERCKEWSSAQAADTGIVGRLSESTYEWTSAAERSCQGTSARLYCFEQ